MRVSLAQMSSTVDRERNLSTAERLVAQAAQAGSTLCVLPELFANLGPRGSESETLQGPTSAWAAATAAKYNIALVAGSINLVHGDKVANTSLVFSPQGTILGQYEKIHLFDSNVPGAVYCESDHVVAGNQATTLQINQECCLGLAICYDLRFPELFRILALQGANVIALPAAFTERTGAYHWEVLLRARAIENQAFILACDQVGAPGKGLRRFGHSMIVDPWGIILAQAPDSECVITADLDFAQQQRYRQQLPSLQNRRPEAYRWPHQATPPASPICSGLLGG